MKFDLLPRNESKRILEGIGKDIVTLHKQRIQNQVEVDGGPMPSLSPYTEERKRKKGGRSKVNATKRMIDSGDFMQNAFQYKVNNDGSGLEVYISDSHHQWKQQLEGHKERMKELTKDLTWEQVRRRNMSTTPLYEGIKYSTIARSQIRNGFGNAEWRHANNPGANFFGLNELEIKQFQNKFMAEAIPIMKENFKIQLLQALKAK